MQEIETSFGLELQAKNTNAGLLAIKSLHYIDKIRETLKANLNLLPNDYAQVVSYVWADDAKLMCLLLRDCTLNVIKLKYLLQSQKKSESEAEQYQQEICTIINRASLELDVHYKAIQTNSQEPSKQWLHQTNPTHIILEQLSTIEDQIKRIQRCEHKIDAIHHSFQLFNKAYLEAIDERKINLEDNIIILSHVEKLIAGNEKNLSKDQLSSLIAEIEKSMTTIENKASFSAYDRIALEDTDKLSVPVSVSGGQLKFKTIDILSEISRWTSINLTNPLRAIDRKVLLSNDKIIALIRTTSNRLKAKLQTMNAEVVEINKNDILKPLQKLLTDHEQTVSQEILTPIEDITNNLVKSINVAEFFNEEYLFLPVNKMSSLNDGMSLIPSLRTNFDWNSIKQSIIHFKNKILYPESIGDKSHISKNIQELLNLEIESEDNALFLRKGFLGSSFLVNRPKEVEKIKNHFNSWNNGFSGSLLITGAYGTGKSNLLELVPHLFPEVESHHVVFGQSLDIHGSKISIHYNLKEVLQFILEKKHNKKCIVTIDNISLFAESPLSLYDHLDSIFSIISSSNDDIYFVVSASADLENRVMNHFQIDNIFTEKIRLEKMSNNDIEEALLLRAFATKLVNEDESEDLRQKAHVIATASGGNIGFAMQQWTNRDNDHSIKLSHRMFDSIAITYKTILAFINLYERIKISDLEKLLDNQEFQNIHSDLDFLLKQKLLLTNNEGWISINPFLRHRIEKTMSDNSVLIH